MPPSAVIDLTQLIPMAMQRLDRSPLFQRWVAGDFVWVISAEMLNEFRLVTNRPELARYIRRPARDALMDKLATDALVVSPVTSADVPHCRDPKDDVVIATAIAARAQFIVTMDGDLHDPPLAARLREKYGIRVAYPGEFLEATGFARRR